MPEISGIEQIGAKREARLRRRPRPAYCLLANVEFRWENWTPLALAELRAAGPEVMAHGAA